MATQPIDRLHAAVMNAEPPKPYTAVDGIIYRDGSPITSPIDHPAACEMAANLNLGFAAGWRTHEKAVADAQRILPKHTRRMREAIHELLRVASHLTRNGPNCGVVLTDDHWREANEAVSAARELLREVTNAK